MSYRSIAQILNEVFDSSDNTLKTTYKTEDEVLNLVLDESGEPALKVTLSGYIPANNIIDGEVSTYTDLPTASEHTNEIYVVDATIGIPLINRKQAGMYRSDGSAWSLLDVDLSADKVYYSGTLTSGNVQDALNEVNATLSGKALAADLTSHLSNISNPHSVIKSQVGLGNVDNTSDADKSVLSATKLTTARTINGTSFDGTANITTANWGTARTLSFTGDVTGSSSVNGSANVATAMTLANSGATAGTYKSVTVDAKGRVTAGTNPTTIADYGITDAYTKAETDSLLSAKMTATNYTGSVGNIISPLTWLPLKKNLLTAQGQSVCTFTRASAATYVDRYGMLKNFRRADTARFTADGLLVESSSTNSLLYSEQFDNSYYSLYRATITANTTETTDPYGTNYADLLKEDTTATNTHNVGKVVSFTSGNVHTASVYAKAKERKYLGIQAGNTGTIPLNAVFDLESRTVYSTGTGCTATIEKLANGWCRCTATATASATASTNLNFHIYNDAWSWTGDGSSGLYIFGAQLEALPFASSYIPTTTAAVTRVYNSTSIANAENIPYYAKDLSMAFDISILGNKASMYALSDASGFAVYTDATGYINVVFGSLTLKSAAAYSAGTKLRVVLIKSGTTLSLYINGVLSISGTVATVPTNQTTFYIGSQNGTTNHFYGYFSNFRIWDFALTSQEAGIA